VSRRIVLLVTSPRLPAGLLTASAWDLVRAHPVYTSTESDATNALRIAGVDVRLTDDGLTAMLDALAGADTDTDTVVWWAGATGDEDLARRLGLRLAGDPGLAELELMYGSWDPPGARLLDAVTVMDRLASPGGDPWKQQQTHQTLARYLLEEAYEAYDAIEAHDLVALREELGDVLLQVVLHARMAEDADQPWSVDDVAGDLVAKMIRRNPHVFAAQAVTDVDDIVDNWERIKREEKARDSAMDGIALSQPALALAAKILSRAVRAGIVVPAPVADDADERGTDERGTDERGTDELATDKLGADLWHLVARAQAEGLDAEAALRRVALTQLSAVRAAEVAPATER
jgi:XTP/dITP diphosphohydrolase